MKQNKTHGSLSFSGYATWIQSIAYTENKERFKDDSRPVFYKNEEAITHFVPVIYFYLRPRPQKLQPIDLIGRVFTSSWETRVKSQVETYQRSKNSIWCHPA